MKMMIRIKLKYCWKIIAFKKIMNKITVTIEKNDIDKHRIVFLEFIEKRSF